MRSAPAIASEHQHKLKSFKGWELYSWQSERQWKFALLAGTNRTKSCAEVKAAKEAKTFDQLKEALPNLDSGQELFWVREGFGNISDRCELALPPKHIVKRLQEDCRKLGLHLTVM